MQALATNPSAKKPIRRQETERQRYPELKRARDYYGNQALDLATQKLLTTVEEAFPDGRAGILLALEGAGPLSERLQGLYDRIRFADETKPLHIILADSAVSAIVFLRTLQQGQEALRHLVAKLKANDALPALVSDLIKSALSYSGICGECCGTGRDEKYECAECEGKGTVFKSGPHKKWAAEQIFRITQLVEEKVPQLNVQTNVGVKMEGLAEQFAKLSYSALTDSAKLVEAESVRVEPN